MADSPQLMASMVRMMKTSIANRKDGVHFVDGDALLAWLESSGAARDPIEAAQLCQLFLQHGILRSMAGGIGQKRFNVGARYEVFDLVPAEAASSPVLAQSKVRDSGHSSPPQDSGERGGDGVGSFAFDGLRGSTAEGSRSESMVDMLASLQLGPGSRSTAPLPLDQPIGGRGGERGGGTLALPPVPEGTDEGPGGGGRKQRALYRPATVQGALLASAVDLRRDLGLTVSVPATDTRTDPTAQGTGSAYTVFGIRLALGSTDGSPPWTVWKRYSEFERLHRALLSRLRVVGGGSLRDEREGALGEEERDKSDGAETEVSVGGLLPTLPGKGIGATISSVLGGGAGVFSRAFVEGRRVKLEEYLRALLRCPDAWHGEDLVLFLDNDTRTLASHLNYQRLIATQRLLVGVSVTIAKRQGVTDRKLSINNREIASMARKMSRLEALMMESRDNERNRERRSGSGDRDTGRRRAAPGNGTGTTQAAAHSPLAASSSSHDPTSPTTGPGRSHDTARMIIQDYFHSTTQAQGGVGAGGAQVETSAQGYMATFGQGALDRMGPVEGSVPDVPIEQFRSQFASKRDALSGDMDAGECRLLLDWVFGPEGGKLNPICPLENPVDGLALAGRVSEEEVDQHRQAVLAKARAEGAEMGCVSEVRGQGRQGRGRGAGMLGDDRSVAGSEWSHVSGTGTTRDADQAGYPPANATGPSSWAAETSPLVPEWLPSAGAVDALDVLSPIATDPVLRALAGLADAIVACVCTNPQAAARRALLTSFVAGLTESASGTPVALTGSSATCLYLPEGDIDLTLLMSPATVGAGGGGQVPASSSGASTTMLQPCEPDWFIRVNEALCMAGQGPSAGAGSRQAAWGGKGSRAGSIPSNASSIASLPLPAIRSVSFINAEVRLVRCVVDAIGVDVSANGTQALAAACLVESVDRWIGRAHLFKRSVLLAKAWCALESGDFTSSLGKGERGILDSGTGGLSSHALTTLLIAVFNTHARAVRHPLHALILLFEEYAEWQWGAVQVGVRGPRHMFLPPESSPELARPAAPRFLTNARLRPFRIFTACCATRDALDLPFDMRNVNILDPVAAWNNLGRSVSRKGLSALTEALQGGRDRMRYILRLAHAESIASGTPTAGGMRAGHGVAPSPSIRALSLLFARTLSWYGRGDGYREDMLAHPLEGGGPSERAARLAALPLPAAPPPTSSLDAVLAGDAAALNRTVSAASLHLSGEISAGLLVGLCKRLLIAHGPLPVGEIGKLLQERLHQPALPSLLKDIFGGLKKLLEAHQTVFNIAQDSHPFNPTVTLTLPIAL